MNKVDEVGFFLNEFIGIKVKKNAQTVISLLTWLESWDHAPSTTVRNWIHKQVDNYPLWHLGLNRQIKTLLASPPCKWKLQWSFQDLSMYELPRNLFC